MQRKKTFTTTVGGAEISASFTDMAENADGSVLVEAGDTAVFVTAVMDDREASQDYFPLSVEFEERFYSVGAILGSRYMRREGRPSREAILNARIIDRTIRPLFPKDLHNEVQVIATVLSFGTYNPDVLAVIGASLALGTSPVPWNGPVSAVRHTRGDDGWKPFTPFDDAKSRTDHLLVCGKEGRITMLEMEGTEVSETDIRKVTDDSLAIVEHLQEWQRGIIADVGAEKVTVTPREVPESVRNLFDAHMKDSLTDAVFDPERGVGSVQKKWDALTREHLGMDERRAADAYLETMIDACIHAGAVLHNRRVDGRGIDEVRTLYAQAGGVSPRLHGSGSFHRGGTRVFTALTLGSPGDALALNTVEDPDANERFMHHYNFPPFSTGETGRVGTPKRREIGHGALAEKALRHVLPSSDEFPYTMRLVSECFSSNGSTSMGSVCASALALMDGGVPITAPVAGIAIGLMCHDDSHIILTDIQGPEDHFGDMDFKVAGTRNGVTAIQMDVKVEGITAAMLTEALEKGKRARLGILDVIAGAIDGPRGALSPYAPHIRSMSIDPDAIGLVIGSGGKTIKTMRTETGADSIDIDDDGTVTVSGSERSVEDAIRRITDLTRSFEEGDECEGEIRTITDFGAFVALSPSKDGMVHISEFTPGRIDSVHAVARVGDVVPVVVKEVRSDGRIALSVKDRDPNFFDERMKNPYAVPQSSSHGPSRGSDRGAGRGGDRGGGRRGNGPNRSRYGR